MPKPVTIAFTGVQGSGKTTLMNETSTILIKNHNFVQAGYYMGNDGLSVSREASKIGFPINESTQFDSQYYMCMRYIVADLATRRVAMNDGCRYIVLDRLVLDVIPYTEASNLIKPEYKMYIKSILYEHFKKFPVNHIFYVEPLKTLVKDDFRSDDRVFHGRILEEYSNLLDYMVSSLGCKFTPIPEDSIENRVKMVIESILSKNSR